MLIAWLRAAAYDLGILAIRAMLGTIFVYHGSQKLFGLFDGPGLAGFTAFLNQLQVPFPAYATVLVAAVEFLGGIALITGLCARLAALPLALTMASAIALVHRDAFSVQQNGMEYPLTLCVVLVGIMISGPGKLTLPGGVARWRRRDSAGHDPDTTSSQNDTTTSSSHGLQPTAPRITTASPEPRQVPTMMPQPPRQRIALQDEEFSELPQVPELSRRPINQPAPRPAAVGQQATRSRILRIDDPNTDASDVSTASRLLPTPTPPSTDEKA